MKHYLLILSLSLFVAAAVAQTSSVTMATYNVDGLPKKLIGISINPDGPGEEYTPTVGQRLENSGWDIIGLNEDFNYHNTLMKNMSSYEFQTYSGDIQPSWEAIKGILAKTWRFKADGLELATLGDVTVANETIVPWEDRAVYGYLTNQNDSLTTKGFRYYTVTTKDNYDIDVMILHADASDDSAPDIHDIRARENAMDQMYNFITKEIHTVNPLVIMGDYNCVYSVDRLQTLFIDRINALSGLVISDAGREMGTADEIDKILYMNRSAAAYTLSPVSAEVVMDFVRPDGTQLTDHHPMCATFSITENTPTGITTVRQKSATDTRKHFENGTLIITKNNKRFSIVGQVIK